MITLNRADVEMCCEDNEISYHTNYSGRFMHGATCFGISGSPRDLITFILMIAPLLDTALVNNPGDPSDDWLNMHSDNMGLDTIYYWPHIQVK